MPNQYGDPTPQEIMQGILDESTQAVQQAQTPQAQRNAILFALGQRMSVDQDPRVRRAKELDDAIKTSMAIERNEGESAIDYEIRKGRDLYGRVKGLDSNTAYQVAERLVTLEEEQFQKSRLVEGDQRDREQHEMNKEGFASQQRAMERANAMHREEGLRYGYNPQTNAVITSMMTHVDNPESQLIMASWAEQGVIPISASEARQRRVDVGEANQKWLGSQVAGFEDQLRAHTDAIILGREVVRGFADAVEQGVNPTANINPLSGTLQALGNSIEEIRRFNNTTDGRLDPNFEATPQPGSAQFKDTEDKVATVVDALNKRGMTIAVPTSLLTLYVYAVAKSQDARVTNMDFETIQSTVSALAGNPEQAYRQMQAQLMAKQEGLMRTLRRMAEEKINSPDPDARAQAEELMLLFNTNDELMLEFDEAGERLKKVSHPPSPPRGPGGTVLKPGDLVYEGEGE
jgi:hypothetical protein